MQLLAQNLKKSLKLFFFEQNELSNSFGETLTDSPNLCKTALVSFFLNFLCMIYVRKK